MRLSQSFLQRVNDLYQSFIKYDATQCDRLYRYRNIEPESALYLAMQIRIQQSKNVLEIGTSTGYSTLWLADAVKQTGGHLTTLEIDAARTAQARQYAQELDVADVIDFWVGDALDYLKQATEQANNVHQYDLILLDAERDAYCDYWPHLQQILSTTGGVLIVDNVISHAAEAKAFMHMVKQDLRFLTTTLPLGAGLFLVTFRA